MTIKTPVGNLLKTSCALEAPVGRVLRGVPPGLFVLALIGAGLLLVAGCGTPQHEEAAPPPAAQAQITSPQKSDSAVQATPISEFVDDASQFVKSKRGKRILAVTGGGIFLGIVMLVFFRIVRGNQAARSRTLALTRRDSPAPELEPSQRSDD